MRRRLLLLDTDDLLILWDALMRHRLALTPGDPEHDEVIELLRRVKGLRRPEQRPGDEPRET